MGILSQIINSDPSKESKGILSQLINSDTGKEYFNRIGINRGIPNFIADRLPAFESVKRRLIDPIFQKPAFNLGGTLVGAPYQNGGLISSDAFMKAMGSVPFYDMKNSYQSGGIISGETIIPSTLFSQSNQTGNFLRPNGVVINRSQQAIRNQKLI